MEDQKKEPRKRLKKPMSAAQYLQTRLSHFAFRHVVSDFSELPERTRQIMVRYYFDLAPIESISEEVGLTGVRIKQIAEKGARRVYKITSQSCRLWDESIRQSACIAEHRFFGWI